MIKSIRLQNFFSFQDCTINLNPGVNVLVGINGSGKSNLLKAIELFKILPKENIEDIGSLVLHKWKGQNGMMHYQSGTTFSELLFEFDQNFVSYKRHDTEAPRPLTYLANFKFPGLGIFSFSPTVLAGGERVYSNYHDSEGEKDVSVAFANLISAADNIYSYGIFDTSEDAIVRKALTYTSDKVLRPDLRNLSNVINFLSINHALHFDLIEKNLQKVNGNYEKLKVIPVLDSMTFGIKETGFEKTTPAYLLSDGSIKFLALLAILYNPNRGQLICLDEPENGLHPDMLHAVAEGIQYAAQTSQIILSTHSPQLLNWFTFEDIRVFEKDENNATIVKELKQQEFEGWYDTYLLGDMWMKGNIGGNRW
ncbi:MAG: AAA family ATPase [Chitinophagales bacterium]